MKTKTIAKILAGKHAAWCKSITDDAVRKVAEDNTIITGGAIVSLLTDQPVADFDCYFRTPEAALSIARYYVAQLLKNPPAAFKGDAQHTVGIRTLLEPAVAEGAEVMRIGGVAKGPLPARVRIVVQSAGVAGTAKQDDYQYFEGAPAAQQGGLSDAYIGAAMGEPAEGQITDDTEPGSGMSPSEAVEAADDISATELDDKPKGKKDEAKRGKYRVLFVTSNAITLSDQMQLIIRFQGDPVQIHENFDYVHATNSWTSWDKQVHLRPEALECILTKELRYIGSRYPLCSVIRLRKFIARGWTVNAGQIIKMLWQVNQLDLADPNVLEDQLVGVDSAYFAQVISALKAKMEKETPADGQRVEVDGTYLMTLIDKVF